MSPLFQRSISTLMLLTVLMTVAPFAPVYAQELPVTSTTPTREIHFTDKATAPIAIEKPKSIKSMRVPMSAYTSAAAECDSTPFTAADGTRTYSGMVAANFLPFGTKFRIPEHFGDKIFTVHDRMHPRYAVKVDVWLEKRSDAKKFGVKRNVLIEIVEMGDGKTKWKKQISKAKQVAVK